MGVRERQGMERALAFLALAREDPFDEATAGTLSAELGAEGVSAVNAVFAAYMEIVGVLCEAVAAASRRPPADGVEPIDASDVLRRLAPALLDAASESTWLIRR